MLTTFRTNVELMPNIKAEMPNKIIVSNDGTRLNRTMRITPINKAQTDLS